MNNIVIEKLQDNKYNYIVFSTTVESPIFSIDKILKQINQSGRINVVFDQLLQTGDNENRFLSFEVDKSIDYNSARILKDNVDELKTYISQYLFKNQEILKYSILLSEQRKIIEKGGII